MSRLAWSEHRATSAMLATTLAVIVCLSSVAVDKSLASPFVIITASSHSPSPSFSSLGALVNKANDTTISHHHHHHHPDNSTWLLSSTSSPPPPPLASSSTSIVDAAEQSEQASRRAFYVYLATLLKMTISPILLLVGGIGNILCIVILVKKKPLNSTVVYLCLLAAFDFLVLYTGLLRLFLKQTFNIDFRNTSSLACKLHIFLTYTVMQISSFILVAVTINRFQIMFQRTLFCKQKKLSKVPGQKENISHVMWIFSAIVALVSLMNVHFLVYYDVLTFESRPGKWHTDCTVDKHAHADYYVFRTKYWVKLNLYLFVIIPCFVLFLLNLLILRKIMVASRARSHATKKKPASRPAATSMSTTLNNPQQQQPTTTTTTAKKDLLKKKKAEKKTSLSVMLVSVCLWFMLLKTPASLYLNFPDEESKVYYAFTYSLIMLINYTNHAVNLFLYIATSSEFRNDFKQFFTSLHVPCFKKRLTSAASTATTAATRTYNAHHSPNATLLNHNNHNNHNNNNNNVIMVNETMRLNSPSAQD